MKVDSNQKQKIAVVGGGVAGLSAAYLLSQKHDVTLIESSDRLGGHANPVQMLDEATGNRFNVDTAFLIFNEHSYENFIQFINKLDVASYSMPAEMTSCFSDSINDLHYSLGNGLQFFLSHPSQILKKEIWQILYDLVLFRKRARHDLQSRKNLNGISAEEYLKVYSKPFIENFVLPLTAAIWSLSTKEMQQYPIQSLLDYFNNHQLLQKPKGKFWRTFQGSSQRYIQAFEAKFKGRIKKSTFVKSVMRTQDGVFIDETEKYDQVVLATHADTSLRLLANPTTQEVDLLSAWKYQKNTAVLHHDVQYLHQDPTLWGSWNMTRKTGDYLISYYLNRLQQLPTQKPIILTLGDISPLGSFRKFEYDHPIFSHASVSTQKNLRTLNGVDRVFFCGSYFGYGFHEDAVKSAVEVAAHFDVDWSF